MAYRGETERPKDVEENRKSMTAAPEWGECASPMQMQGIGWAVKNMFHGIPVRRRGWNGRGMFIAIQLPDSLSKMTEPYVYMKAAHGELIPWLCSQADLLATDWEAATIS
jgi:Protein of unknown function (DUF2829)